jgi:hypothetical protein
MSFKHIDDLKHIDKDAKGINHINTKTEISNELDLLVVTPGTTNKSNSLDISVFVFIWFIPLASLSICFKSSETNYQLREMSFKHIDDLKHIDKDAKGINHINTKTDYMYW